MSPFPPLQNHVRRIAPVCIAPVCLALGLIAPWTPARANLPAAGTEMTAPQVTVIGRDKLPELGGAGQIIGPKELETSRVLTANEALRKVAGK